MSNPLMHLLHTFSKSTILSIWSHKKVILQGVPKEPWETELSKT